MKVDGFTVWTGDGPELREGGSGEYGGKEDESGLVNLYTSIYGTEKELGANVPGLDQWAGTKTWDIVNILRWGGEDILSGRALLF